MAAVLWPKQVKNRKKGRMAGGRCVDLSWIQGWLRPKLGLISKGDQVTGITKLLLRIGCGCVTVLASPPMLEPVCRGMNGSDMKWIVLLKNTTYCRVQDTNDTEWMSLLLTKATMYWENTNKFSQWTASKWHSEAIAYTHKDEGGIWTCTNNQVHGHT